MELHLQPRVDNSWEFSKKNWLEMDGKTTDRAAIQSLIFVKNDLKNPCSNKNGAN